MWDMEQVHSGICEIGLLSYVGMSTWLMLNVWNELTT